MDKMFANAINVASVLIQHNYEAYFVGGFVRDSIMNLPAKDIDITTSALPEDVQQLFTDHIDTGLVHGTVSVRLQKNSDFYEVTTYRVDGEYTDGRHPDAVKFTRSLEEDLARRDFTMNAIAMHPLTKEYVDPYGGRIDIENKIVRCVGDAKSRFIEDPLRVLRAMRFAIKYGFTIEDSTKNAMHDNEVLAKLDECISKERITDELRKMLTCGQPVHDIFLEFSDIISVILPDMKACVNSPHNSRWHKHDIYEHILYVVDGCKSNKFEIKLAALLHDIGKPACRTHDEDGIRDHFHGHPEKSYQLAIDVFNRDLVVSNAEKATILELVLHHDDKIEGSYKAVRRFVINLGEDVVRDWLILKRADMDDHRCAEGEEEKWNTNEYNFSRVEPLLDEVMANENAFKVSDLEVNGYDIMQFLNIKPGPTIKIILNGLFNAVIDDKVPNKKQDLLNYITLL